MYKQPAQPVQQTALLLGGVLRLLARHADGLLHQQILRTDRFGDGRLFLVAAVGLKHARLDRIVLHGEQNIMQPCADRRTVDRAGDFNAALGVSRHQIGRGNVHFLVFAAAEHIDTRMLEKTADNAGNGDVFGLSGNAGKQAADAADA